MVFVLKAMDVDRDGCISRSEFRKALLSLERESAEGPSVQILSGQ